VADQILKILIVGDDRIAASTLEGTLRKHRLVIETDPAVAMQRLNDGQWFDVVVSDSRMPGANGLELLAAARKLPDPPILVLMSGDDELGANDADATFSKPFEVADLIALITTVATRRAGAMTRPLLARR
jgi:CheY-like chemotaxis protein